MAARILKGKYMAGKTKKTAEKKKNVRTSKRATVYQRPQKASVAFSDYFRFGESYTSLILGIVVVVIAAILLIAFVKARNAANPAEQATSSTTFEETAGDNVYIVQSGDDLWKIAESEYDNGYNWVEIARENNISDPNVIQVGSKLVIPAVEETEAQETEATAAATTQAPTPTPAVTQETEQEAQTEQKIAGDSYTVQAGDYLWDIAVRAYGDGYRWVEIARANNLTNPDVVHSGNKLTIPRS
jgi:putative chitinase